MTFSSLRSVCMSVGVLLTRLCCLKPWHWCRSDVVLYVNNTNQCRNPGNPKGPQTVFIMQICETDNKALYQPSMMQGINTLIQSVIHLPFNKLFLGVFMPEVSHVYATFFFSWPYDNTRCFHWWQTAWLTIIRVDLFILNATWRLLSRGRRSNNINKRSFLSLRLPCFSQVFWSLSLWLILTDSCAACTHLSTL